MTIFKQAVPAGTLYTKPQPLSDMSYISRFFAAAIALSMISVAQADDSKLKIITVDMQALFDGYDGAVEAQKEGDAITAEIKKDNEERIAKIKELEDSLKTLTKQIQDSTISVSKRDELLRDRQAKLQEGQALERERREFLQRRNRALGEKMEIHKKEILDKIAEKVQEQAKLKGYDFVFGKYELNNTQVTVVLYAKGSTDGTADILKALNKDAPK